jgi:hypothetical protein
MTFCDAVLSEVAEVTRRLLEAGSSDLRMARFVIYATFRRRLQSCQRFSAAEMLLILAH